MTCECSRVPDYNRLMEEESIGKTTDTQQVVVLEDKVGQLIQELEKASDDIRALLIKLDKLSSSIDELLLVVISNSLATINGSRN